MALKSSREGLRKELVDYLGNIIIDDNLRNEIIKVVGDNFVTSESLNETVNNLTMQITTESGERVKADTTLQNNINAETTAREQAISNLEEAISNIPSINPLIAYPIGSVYFSVNDTNPSTILGGTWELVGTKLAVRENVFGNGYTLPLTDGNNIGGLCVAYSGGYVTTGLSGLYGQPVNTNKSGEANLPLDKGLGIPTKAQLGTNLSNSGLIVDAETIYSWKRVA